jgi:hypothetical protein
VTTPEAVKNALDFQAFYTSEVGELKPDTKENYKAKCPFHEDDTPSLSVNLESGLFKCFGCQEKGDVFTFYQKKHGCDFREAMKKLSRLAGLNGDRTEAPKARPRIVRTYDYEDPKGNLLSQVCRFEPKDFRQRHPDGKGNWIWDMKGVPRVPYHLPQIMSVDPGVPVFVCEGERDVDALIDLGLTATCNPMGAGTWRKEYNQYFKGLKVIILPDNDRAGRDHGQQVAQNLYGVAASVKVVELPGLPEKGDVSDWLKAGGTTEQLLSLAEAAPEWKPAQDQEEDSPEDLLIFKANDFVNLDLQPKRVILHPWISEYSIIMIYGPRGVGKTMLVFGLLDSITRGVPFGPWEVITPVRCLYLDGEMPPQDTAERLDLLARGKRLEELFIYSDAYTTGLGRPKANLLDDEWRQAMKKSLLKRGIKVWVVDNLASLAPGIDENSKEQYDPINQWFLELRAAGITTIFLHHAGKSGLQRGTSGREDNIDVSLFLDRPKDYSPEQGARFVTKFEKSRVRHADSYLLGEMELQAAPDKDTGVYVWAFGNQKKNTRIEVLRLLDEGVTVSAIAPAVKISTSMVYRLRREAVEEGLLQEENFRLTPSGKT